MLKSFFICISFCVTVAIEGLPQSLTQSTVSTYSYYPPSTDKDSWQRLNLMMSATYFRVVKEGEVDFDSCLLYASRSLGLSRLPVVGEGIDNPELLAQSQWVDRRDPAEGIRSLSLATGKKRLETLLLLGAYYAFEPRINYQTDSVEYFLFKVINESNSSKEGGLRRQALCLLGKMYIQTNEFQKGDSVFVKVIRECEAADDKATEARAFEYRALYPEYNPASSPARITWFEKAAAIYHQLKNTEGEINVLTDAGYMLVTTYQLQRAQDSFSRAMQLAEAISFPYLHYNKDALAMVTMFQGKFGEPLKYTLETIKSAEVTRDSIGLAYFYNRLAQLYDMEGGREEENLKWLLKALDRFVISRDASLSQNLYSVVLTLCNQGRGKEAFELAQRVLEQIPPSHPQDQIFYNLSIAYAYLAMRQYDRAEQYASEAERILKQSATLRSAYQRGIINLFYGQLYFDTQQFGRSRKFLEAYLAEPLRSKGAPAERTVYEKLIRIDSVSGDATAAVNHYKRYKQVIDSVYRVSKIRQAEELQVIYQTQEKENQIAVLHEQAKLVQANAKQATLVRNVTIAGIIAMLVIAGLLYRQNRLKQRNNTVITHKNGQLQHLLTEKEWLLKEIHHRVKNNLQIVMSLLNSQSAFIDNAPALTAIHDSQHRVHAMSLIHQKLYNTENVSSIAMPSYIRELASYLAESFNTRQRIRFEFDIAPLELDVSQAVPVGLILNEAITNSIKYAFPNVRNAVISISLSHTDLEHCLLSISDNGIGIPAHFKNKKPGSLGMSLIEGLSEDLEGIFSIKNNNGTTIKISFAHEQSVRRTGTLAPFVSASDNKV